MNTQTEGPNLPCAPGATRYAALSPQLRAGTLPQRDREALRRHLRGCVTCQQEAAAAADEVVAEGVRRQYGVPSGAAPFLTFDDIRRRVSQSDGAHDIKQDTNTTARVAHGELRRPGDLNHRGIEMTLDEQQPPTSPADSWVGQSARRPTRWRTVAGITAAVAIIALFALLLRGFADGKGAGPATTDATATPTTAATPTPVSNAHGLWHTGFGMAYTTQMFTQTPPYPSFSPKDPSIVYQATLTPFTVRRSDDGGATWRQLTLPSGSDQAIVIEVFASPLEAHTVFLTVTVNLAYGQGPEGCPTSAKQASLSHGNIQASGQMPCSATYRSTDEGKTWKAINFPVNGTISTLQSDSAPYAGSQLQAQGARLYALLSCGPTCINPGGRLVVSTNGGASWQVADGHLGSGVCDFAAQPGGQTVYAAISNGMCSVLNSPSPSLYRSDNAGRTWAMVGNLPKGAAVQGMAAVIVGGKPMLVLNTPQVNWQPHIIGVTQSADEFRISVDGGYTWKTSPLNGVPDKAQPVVAPLIVRADGSLVVAFSTDPMNAPATVYSWKPGATTWNIFAPAPADSMATLFYTTSASGDETLWAVLRNGSSPTDGNAFVFDVARYQP